MNDLRGGDCGRSAVKVPEDERNQENGPVLATEPAGKAANTLWPRGATAALAVPSSAAGRPLTPGGFTRGKDPCEGLGLSFWRKKKGRGEEGERPHLNAEKRGDRF